MTKGRAGRSFERSFALRAKRKAVCLAMCGALALLGSPLCVAAINFGPPASYPVGTSPVAIAVGDFNGDGKIDIAVANNGSGDVSILLGNGDGTFQTATDYSAGNSPTDIAVGDFNGDGKLDLAVFQSGANGGAVSVSILLGNGDGTFQAPKTLALTASLGFIAVADFDGDKKTDLAVCNSTTLDIFIGNGDGTFQAAKSTALSSGCRGLFTADFNNDSKPDLGLITADGLTTGAIQILLGNGEGTFSTGPLINISGEKRPVIATDLNHDGKVDLVVSSSEVSCQSGPPTVCRGTIDISVFLGNGDGTFQGGQSVTSLSFAVPSASDTLPVHAIVGDFNGDGKLDLAYHSTYLPGAHVSGVLLGKGDGSFSSSVVDVPLPGNVPSIAQDLNGDKLADLIAVGAADNVEVWLNTSSTSGTDLALLSPAVSAGPYVAASNITFTTDVINQGPKDATGVAFTDTLPGGLTFVSATSTTGSCVQAKGVVSCMIGALASAFDSSISIVATPTAVGTISNTMSVSGNESDPVLTNNSATQTVSIVPVFTLTVTDAGTGSGTVTASVGAINCGSTCTATYPQGTSVSLTAAPSASSVFSAWDGACTGTDPNTCTIVVDSAQSVTATFAPAPDFALALASASLTLRTGAQATDALTLTAQNGFSGQVNLSCVVNGPAPLAACSVSPASVTFGTSTGNSLLTVTAPTSLTASTTPFGATISMAAYAAIMPFSFLLMGGMALASRGPRKRRIGLGLMGGSLLVLLCCLAGCGGGSSPPPQNYTVTVTATSAASAAQHSANVSLTVN